MTPIVIKRALTNINLLTGTPDSYELTKYATPQRSVTQAVGIFFDLQAHSYHRMGFPYPHTAGPNSHSRRPSQLAFDSWKLFTRGRHRVTSVFSPDAFR